MYYQKTWKQIQREKTKRRDDIIEGIIVIGFWLGIIILTGLVSAPVY